MRKAREPQSGFTLIELMITVAIVAVLARIAYPSYISYIKKGLRSSAQAQMLDLANREQQYLLATRNYGSYSALTTAGYTLPTELSTKYTPDITVGVSTVPAFTITFTAIGSQASDGALTYTSDGTKLPTGKW